MKTCFWTKTTFKTRLWTANSSTELNRTGWTNHMAIWRWFRAQRWGRRSQAPPLRWGVNWTGVVWPGTLATAKRRRRERKICTSLSLFKPRPSAVEKLIHNNYAWNCLPLRKKKEAKKKVLILSGWLQACVSPLVPFTVWKVSFLTEDGCGIWVRMGTLSPAICCPWMAYRRHENVSPR